MRLWLLLFLLLITAPAVAQDARQLVRQHRYTDAIEQLRGRDGRMDGLSPQDLGVLGVAHLQRAYMLRDLAAVEVTLGAKYYHRRDTSQNITRSRWTKYFLGRHLVAQGDCQGATPYLDATLGQQNLTGEYHTRAQIWKTACAALEGQTASWNGINASDAVLTGELAYAQAITGTPDADVACGSGGGNGAAATRCRLWAAIREGEAQPLYPLQQRLLRDALPDQEQIVGANLTLRFYDPATLAMLADADFVAAAEAFTRLGNAQSLLFAGIGAYESGHVLFARNFLERADQPLAEVYLGALDYLAGNTTAAETRWRQARAAGAKVEIAWMDVASRFTDQHAAIRSAGRTYVRRPPQDRNDARLAAYALLRAGGADEALALLEAVYPPEYDNQIDVIEPGFLVTLAHARLMAGRSYYPMVRSHLATVATVYPAAISVLDLAQGYTAPERALSINKRTD